MPTEPGRAVASAPTARDFSRRAFLAIVACAGVWPRRAGAQRSTPPPAGRLAVSGSRIMLPLIADVAALFQDGRSGVRIEVKGGGSVSGTRDVLARKSDIGMVARALTPQEKTLQSFAIARDGIGAIVHRSNPVEALTRTQMRDIFTGRAANWRSVGGLDAPIELLGRGAARGATQYITEFLGIDAAAVRAKGEVEESVPAIRAVAARPNAISYVSTAMAQRDMQAGTPVKLLSLEGVAATSANVRSGDFPLTRPLLLVTRELPLGLTRSFIEFALSAQVASLIRDHEFAPYAD